MTQVYTIQKCLDYEEYTVIGVYSSNEKLIEAIKSDLKAILLNEKEELITGTIYPGQCKKDIETILAEDGLRFINYLLDPHSKPSKELDHYQQLCRYTINFFEIDKIYPCVNSSR